MFIPIGDENPRETTPYVNYALLGANIVAFFLFCFPQPTDAFLRDWAMVPKLVSLYHPPSLTTLFTSMFLHANILHIAGNMLFLWIFGDNVEDRLGHIPYIFFYFLCGIGADVLHILMSPTGNIPTIGASGAISGVIGAYVLFFPRHRVKMLVWIFIFYQVFLVPAWAFIGIWFLEQLFMMLYIANRVGGGVAYGAHVGGFVAGVFLGLMARLTYAGSRTAKAGLSARAHPEEISSASRWGDRSRPVFQPLITVEHDEPGIVYVDGPESRYAVLRMSDELYNISRIAAVAAAMTGESASTVARRIAGSRGMIAKDVPRATAQRLQITFRQQGLPTLVVPYGSGFMPPAPATLDKLGWDDLRISLTTRQENQTVPWRVPFLYLGAVIGSEPLVDIYVNTHSAFRVTGHTDIRIIDPFQRREFRGNMRDFATAVIDYQEGAAINDGIRVLAHRGSWGWLNFKIPGDFENYSFWLYNLILSNRPLQRYQR